MNLEYGKILKSLREKNNISQKEIAEAIGIKRSSYNQFEQQYDIIPIKRLNQIANFFNVSLDYLFGFTNIPNYEDNLKEIDLNISSVRLKEFRKSNNLTQEELAKVINASPSVLIHHETKRTVLGTPFLYTICKTYKISADYLLGKTNETKKIL